MCPDPTCIFRQGHRARAKNLVSGDETTEHLKFLYQCKNKRRKFLNTVDREFQIFTLKIISVKIFGCIKFSQFCLIYENFLIVDGHNMDEHLECS